MREHIDKAHNFTGVQRMQGLWDELNQMLGVREPPLRFDPAPLIASREPVETHPPVRHPVVQPDRYRDFVPDARFYGTMSDAAFAVCDEPYPEQLIEPFRKAMRVLGWASHELQTEPLSTLRPPIFHDFTLWTPSSVVPPPGTLQRFYSENVLVTTYWNQRFEAEGTAGERRCFSIGGRLGTEFERWFAEHRTELANWDLFFNVSVTNQTHAYSAIWEGGNGPKLTIIGAVAGDRVIAGALLQLARWSRDVVVETIHGAQTEAPMCHWYTLMQQIRWCADYDIVDRADADFGMEAVLSLQWAMTRVFHNPLTDSDMQELLDAVTAPPSWRDMSLQEVGDLAQEAFDDLDALQQLPRDLIADNVWNECSTVIGTILHIRDAARNAAAPNQ
jgi:hypothetical protein